VFYKKDDPYNLNNYRRIGLENTIHKIWTSMITRALTHYSEENGILTKGQAGFRPKHSTTQQTSLLTTILEDAHIHQKDLLLLMLDFTEAFDTIDQQKLPHIMADLGFPPQALANIKDLYTNHITSVRTPHQESLHIPITRGTLQGDSLSPFIFTIYIIPLLQWLAVGNRGYHTGTRHAPTCTNTTKHHLTDISYADDVNILCHTLPNLKIQIDKIERY